MDTYSRATTFTNTICSTAATVVTTALARAATAAVVAEMTSAACTHASFIQVGVWIRE